MKPALRRAARVFLLAALVAAVLAGVSSCRPGGVDPARVWADVQRDLGARPVASVELIADGRDNTAETGAEADALADAFLAGTFDEDNPENFGPTAAVVTLFRYEGLEPLAVNQWPDGRFELRKSGRQFLIASPELAELLRERGFVYR